MVERIRAAGGETVVDTARGKGTRVRVRIPIAPGLPT